ncbi:MAG: phosphoribosylanthranilate isomerase [Deltaproteobacteria bacterium]|nr:phosphoribosylanthranilate isomerase [Deltaproteobacteria bacterium]
MTEIKICGITRVEDALIAAASGADAVGFILHPSSPRYIAPERAKEIIAALPHGIVAVGVFVNRDAETVARTAADCGLDLIQLHGDESPEYCRRFPAEKLIKAVFPRTADDLPSYDAYDVRALLVDCREKDRFGGTGKPADWGLAAMLAKGRSVILAGGLCIENIAESIAAVSPGAVDINSGIETTPGIKDHDRIKRIISLIRESGHPGPNTIFHMGHVGTPCGKVSPCPKGPERTTPGTCSGSPKGPERVPGRQKGPS